MTVRRFHIDVSRKLWDRSIIIILHYVSKNDTDVAYDNFNAHQPIFVIFGRDVAEGVC